MEEVCATCGFLGNTDNEVNRFSLTQPRPENVYRNTIDSFIPFPCKDDPFLDSNLLSSQILTLFDRTTSTECLTIRANIGNATIKLGKTCMGKVATTRQYSVSSVTKKSTIRAAQRVYFLIWALQCMTHGTSGIETRRNYI